MMNFFTTTGGRGEKEKPVSSPRTPQTTDPVLSIVDEANARLDDQKTAAALRRLAELDKILEGLEHDLDAILAAGASSL